MAALALPAGGASRTARRFLLANGAMWPFLVFQMYVHELIWIGSLWAITFPGASWALAGWFRRARRNAQCPLPNAQGHLSIGH